MMRLAPSLLPALLLLGASPCLADSTAEIENKTFYSLTIAIGDNRGATVAIGSEAAQSLQPASSFTLPAYGKAVLILKSGEKAFTVKGEQEEGTATFKDEGMVRTDWVLQTSSCSLIRFEAKGKAVTVVK